MHMYMWIYMYMYILYYMYVHAYSFMNNIFTLQIILKNTRESLFCTAKHAIFIQTLTTFFHTI